MKPETKPWKTHEMYTHLNKWKEKGLVSLKSVWR